MECPVCACKFKSTSNQPCILPGCGHTLCLPCVSTLFYSGSVKCPQCLRISNSPSPNAFPINFAILEITASKESVCVKHGKNIEAYCERDRMVLCVSCILEDGHNSHEILAISKAAKEYKTYVEETLNSLEQSEHSLIRIQTEIDSMEDTAKDTYAALEAEYIELYQAIKSALEERQVEILKKLKENLDSEIDSIQTKREVNMKGMENILYTKQGLKEILKMDDLDVLLKGRDRDSILKSSAVKIIPVSPSRPFSTFNKETEVNYIWKIIKNFFGKSLLVNSKKPESKKEEEVPLALATAMFSKDLRSHSKTAKLETKSNRNIQSSRKQGTITITRSKTTKLSYKAPSSASTSIYESINLRRYQSTEAVPIPIKQHSLIQDDFPCLDFSRNMSSSRIDSSFNTYDLASLCKPSRAFIYTMGGFSDKGLRSVERYECEENRWSVVSQCLTSRTQSASVILDDSIYILGGKMVTNTQNGKRVATCEEYKTDEDKWNETDLVLSTPRSGFSALSITNDIYVIGGSIGAPVRTFEMYCNNECIPLPNMKDKRDELGAAVGPDLQIYAVGGYGGNEMACLNTAERYDIGEGKWEYLPNMKKSRRALTAVTLPDGVYAIGGYDGEKYLKSMEKFDIRTGSWISLAPMNYERCTFSAVVSPDCQHIYAIGGFNGNPIGTVERYSVIEDKWTVVQPLQNARFMHTSVIVYD